MKRFPIIIPFAGGLGNQLFQLAFAHNLKARGVRFPIIDVTGFNRGRGASERLLEIQPSDYGFPVISHPVLGKVTRVAGIGPLCSKEATPGEEMFKRIRPWNVRVFGFHQNLNSAVAASELLETVFADKARQYPDHGDRPYVAVHSRLGDYLNIDTARFHGITDPEWLIEKALEIAAETKVEKIRVFTDSPEEFVKRTKQIHDCEIEIDNSHTSWEALLGMARATGLVISNSTLSWWAAFLATQVWERAIPVVAPCPWFAQPSPIDESLHHNDWRVLRRAMLEVEQS